MSYLLNILNECQSQLIYNKKQYLFFFVFLILVYVATGILFLTDFNLKKNLFSKSNDRTIIITWGEKNNPSMAKLVNQFKHKYKIKELKIYTPNDAKRILTQTSPIKLQFDDTTNPIDSYTAVIKLGSNRKEFKAIIQELKSNEKIEDVLFDSEKVDVWHNLRIVYKYISTSIFLVFAAVLIFITIMTFKTIILTNERRLKIMHIIGASPHFIRFPYIINSATLGLIASFIGLLLLKAIQIYLKKRLYTPPLWIDFEFFYKEKIIFLSIINILLPVIGSFWVTKKIN